ncbi:MAG: OmpA family protein, partial [Rhodospirillales bacterium]
GDPAGEVLIDSSVLDNLGRDPYGRAAPPSPAAQQRKPQLKAPPKSKAPAPAPGPHSQAPGEWTPAPYATLPQGGLLPPPGPGELERRQQQINAALGRAQPAPAAPAAAPAKPGASPAKSAAAKKPGAAGAKPPSAAPVAPVTAAPAHQLPQFQQPAYQPPAPMAATPAVPPLPGSALAPTPEPPPMAPPTPPPAAFSAPPRPAVSPVPTAASAPPPASTPMAAAPTQITPPAKAPAGQAAQPQSPVRIAAPAPGAATAPALPPPGQPASRPPQGEPAPVFAPSGKSAARVNFLAGSSDLPENAKPQLKAVAEQMNRDADMRVQLLAYAGPREDTASQTRRLSLFRALAVRTYLIEQGIRSTRMDVRAMGNKYDDEPADRVDVVIADR